MASDTSFRRLLLSLPHSATDYASIEYIGEFAELLGLDIVGLFVEDKSLMEIASLPGIRELHVPEGNWKPIDVAQLALVVDRASADAQRLFVEVAKTLRVATSFDVAKGSLSEAIGARSHADDILVIVEPKNPAERMTLQFRQFIDVAFKGPSSVMLVPSRISRRKGPVVAVVADENDPSFHAALRIAGSIKERLIAISPAGTGDEQVGGRSSSASVPIDRIAMGARPNAAALLSLLARIDERMLVLNREIVNHTTPPQLVSGRGVPVLLTGQS